MEGMRALRRKIHRPLDGLLPYDAPAIISGSLTSTPRRADS